MRVLPSEVIIVTVSTRRVSGGIETGGGGGVEEHAVNERLKVRHDENG